MKHGSVKRIVALALLALLMSSFTAVAFAAPYRTLYYGDSGSDVKDIQRRLKALGFFSGDIGGNYLDLTTKAVRKFENYHGYGLTSYCTVKMQKNILNATRPNQVYRTLHYGDYGEDVRRIQKHLSALGYFNGTFGGNYLKLTRAAVRAFQADHNYKVTNYCTKSMQHAILNA